MLPTIDGNIAPVSGGSDQSLFSPLTPEQLATAVDQSFQEETYQLKIHNKQVALCNCHGISAGQAIGEIKGRSCYITQLPSGKLVAFQDWYGRPILMNRFDSVVMLGSLSHHSEDPGLSPVYQGFVLEGCHRFLVHSRETSNCDVELYSADNPDIEIESDDGSAPVYGKDALLRLVSNRAIAAGSKLILPSGIFPAFTAESIDDRDDVQALKKACLLSMKSSLADSIPEIWNLTSFPSLKLLNSTLSISGAGTQKLAATLDANSTDKTSITSLFYRVCSQPQLLPLFILANLKRFDPENRDTLATVAKRMKRNEVCHPEAGAIDWVKVSY